MKHRAFAIVQYLRPLAKWCGILALLTGVTLSGPASAETQPVDRIYAERLVKAAYLYKFGSYVVWPERSFAKPDSPLKIGIIGDDELAEELARMVIGRTSNGRPLTVHKIRPDATMPRVHVLFIGGTNRAQIADMLTSFKGQPLLTVTETDHALNLGSMINFVAIDGKLRFEVSPIAAGVGDLAMSPKLFPIAHKVASAPR
ncbi:MAG: hypothetical protein JWQ23_640 [Herminiimonas sp.]|nr:hypothetical protein [Herminiimonas sp.]